MASTSKQTGKKDDSQATTTTITMVVDDEQSTEKAMPDWMAEVKGLVYLDEHDGFIDPDAIKIEPPKCIIDDTVQPIYQCIKCGNKQSNREDIHRMKCTRCYNKAFNKIRPTKWVKFKAY